MRNPDFAFEFEKLLSQLKDESLSITNLLLRDLGKQPVTYGDKKEDSEGNREPGEVCFTMPEEFYSYQCLDHLLEVKTLEIAHEEEEKLQFRNARVEKMLIEGRQYSQLSDHYGVAVELHL